MSENKNLDFFELLILIVKRKKILIPAFILSLMISYAGIYFFVPAQYASQAIIMPNETDKVGQLPTMLKNMANLTSSLSSIKKTTTADYYKTVIYSRPMMDKLIDTFQLMKDYNIDSKEKMLKAIKKNIRAEENDQGAFEIEVTAHGSLKAADMTNFLVDELNSRIIEFNSKKSKDNRLFVENRYNEVVKSVLLIQDSLKNFQKRTG
ncbi:MAG: hypothetical protein HYV28_08990, partial [Ignavibacteriales bacterium]|nr:hypothetical protein [Ignavibacteriales bacterium]